MRRRRVRTATALLLGFSLLLLWAASLARAQHTPTASLNQAKTHRVERSWRAIGPHAMAAGLTRTQRSSTPPGVAATPS